MAGAARIIAFSHPTNKDTGWLSQWYPCRFREGKDEYTSCEQYMMVKKALLFDDKEAAEKMRNTHDPKTLLHMGRKVANFDQTTWDKHKEQIVEQGNFLKFSQNAGLCRKLLDTGDAVLVETFSHDRIWACGLKYNDPNVQDATKWTGQNLLGYAIMRARERLHGAPVVDTTPSANVG